MKRLKKPTSVILIIAMIMSLWTGFAFAESSVKTIAFFGDSLMKGVDGERLITPNPEFEPDDYLGYVENTIPDIVRENLGEGFSALNLATDGFSLMDGSALETVENTSLDVDSVVLSFSTGDYANIFMDGGEPVSEEVLENNLAAYKEALNAVLDAIDVPVIILGYWRHLGTELEEIAASTLDEILEETANEKGASFISQDFCPLQCGVYTDDFTETVEIDGEEIDVIGGISMMDESPQYHPGQAGYEKLGNWLYAEIEEIVTVPKKITVEGSTVYIPYASSESEPVGNIDIAVPELDIIVTSNEEGLFSFEIEEGEDITLVVADTDEYAGDTKDLSNTTLILKERFTASLDMFEMPEWIDEEAGEFTVTAKEGYELSLARDGEFSDSVTVAISDGEESPIYVRNSEGNVSKPFNGLAMVDSTAPKLINVDVTSEDASIKPHGIYGNGDINLLITVSFEETESGFKKAELIGESGAVYPAISEELIDDIYTATFKISSEDVLTDTLSIKAEDNVGNVSELSLIRGDNAASTVIIERNEPEIAVSVIEPNENGWYNESVSVEAEVSDNDSGISSITGYTDGEISDSTSYEEKMMEGTLGLQVEHGIHTISFEAIDNSGNASSDEITVKVDTAAPEIDITGLTGIVREASDITITVTEDFPFEDGEKVSVEIIKDGASSSRIYEKVDSVTIPGSDFTDGAYKIKALAIDAAGNTSEEKVITFTIDSDAPTLSGHFDREPNENGWYNDEVTFIYEVGDDLTGVSSIEVFVNGTPVSVNNGIVITRDLIESLETDSSYTVKVIVTDNAGNSSEVEGTCLIDIISPNLTFSGIEKESYNESPTLNIESDEKHVEGSVIKITIDRNGEIEEKTYKNSPSVSLNNFVEDGHYTITVNSLDPAGNMAEEKSVSFIVDKEAPVLERRGFDKAPNENGWVNEPSTYFYSVDDKLSGVKEVRATVNGVDVETSNGKVIMDENVLDLLPGGGNYTVKITAMDNAGNESEIEDSIKIDVTKPEITLSNIEDEKSYQGSPVLNAESNEKNYAEAKITVIIEKDGVAVEKVYEGVNLISVDGFKEDGHYTVKVSSIDAAGNNSEEKVISCIVDNENPVITDKGTSPAEPENKWFNSEVTFNFEATDVLSGLDTISATLNNNGVGITDSSVVITEPLIEERINDHGTYTVELTTRDKAGNVETYTRTLKIDIVKPELSIEGIEREFYNNSPSVKVLSNEKHFLEAEITVKILKDGKPMSEETYPSVNEVPLSEFTENGFYEIIANSVDAAGNKAKEKSANFTLDNVPPTITGSFDKKPNENGWFNEEFTFTYEVSDNLAGISEIKAYINGTEVATDGKSVLITKGLIESLINANGSYVVKVVAKDNAGNEAEIEDIALIDIVKPVLSLSGIEEGKNYNEVPVLNIEQDEKHLREDGAVVTVTIIRNGESKDNEYKGASSISTNAFSEDGHYTVKVNAIDAAGNKADEKEISFTVDMTKPVMAGHFDRNPNENGWYSAPLSFVYEVTDETSGVKSITAYVNGKEVETDGKSIELSKSLIESLINKAGSYEVKVVAVDNAGNEYEITDSAQIDIVKPNLTLSGIEEGKNYKEIPILNIESDEKHYAEKGSSITVSIIRDGNEVRKSYDGVNKLSVNDFNTDGHYIVKVNSVDAAGNNADEKVITFVIDRTPPVIAGKFTPNPNGNGWYNGPVTYVYEASDATSGIQEISAYVNGSHVDTSNGNVEITERLITSLGNKDGTYSVKVVVTDKAGNKVEIENSSQIDIVSPVITLSNIEEGKNYQQAPNLNILSNEKHFAEPGAAITVTVERNGKPVEKTYDRTDSISMNEFKEDGHYTVKVNSVDAAGNKSEEKVISFVVDNTHPVITDKGITPSENGNGWLNSEVTFKFDPTDETAGIDTVTATVNGKSVPVTNSSVVITRSLIEETINSHGTYTVEITAKDKSGNEKVYARTLKIDLVNPNLSFSGADEGAFYQSAPTVTISSDEKHFSEPGESISVVITRNGSKISEKTYDRVNNVSLTDFSEDGKYTISITSRDAAGNEAERKELTFTKDGTSPVITDNGPDRSPNSNGWFNSSITANFDISDATSGAKDIRATVNGVDVPYQDGGVVLSEGIVRDLANDSGTFDIVVTAIDYSGNSEEIRRTYRIDLDRPNLSLDGVEQGKHYQSSPVLSVSSDDRYALESGHVITIDVARDGSSVYTESFSGARNASVSPFIVDGDYTVRISAVDAAGNVAESKEISFVKDETAPVITITGVEEGKYYNVTTTPEMTIRERYFQTSSADVTIIKTLNGVATNIPVPFNFTGEISSLTRSISEPGFYTITVTARDEVGNTAEEKKVSFFVDTIPPIVKITGVENSIYTYDDIVAPVITYEDDYFDSVTFTLTRAGEKHEIPLIEQDGRITFNDFAKIKKNDGIYILTAVVTDKAGNRTEETVTFTVNRFGSYFKYDANVENINGKHVTSVPNDLVIYEYNVAKLKNTKEDIKLDGKSIVGVTSGMFVKEENGYRVVKHTFNKESFEKEGVYEINVVSEDLSGNRMESQAENGVVKFVVDRTSPTITISGLGRYINADSATAKISIMDGLSLDSTVAAYLNGEPCELIKTEDGFEVVIGSGNNQKLKIVATDAAGNESESEMTVSVIPSGFMYTLTKSAAPIIASGVGVISLALLLLFLAKRRKEDKDESSS